MIKVGITGGIGSGKSTVAHLYEMMGYPVYYADMRAKWLINNDPSIKAKLIATFGHSIYPEQLDRKALADIVFSNPDALTKLNNITHPSVENDFQAWSKKQSSSFVFKEAAILFESGTYHSVDKIICVVAPEITRIMRVMKRDHATASQVQERITNQWSDEKKMTLSDFIINANDQQLVIPQALDILMQLEHS